MIDIYPLNESAWTEWEEWRRTEKRRKIGPVAQKKQIQMLCSYPPSVQQQIIDASIMNSWQGLFPPKAKPQSTRQTTLAEDLGDTSWV